MTLDLDITTAIAAVLVGYLAGSIPFGLLVTRAAGHGDVRRIGSGNIDATNVLRTGSKGLAALTLLLDALKGTIPVLVFARYSGEAAALLAGLAAFAGHVWPVWLKFHGGKGVATYLGVLFGLSWPYGLAFLVIWLTMAALFRVSSLSALTASALLPFAAAFQARWLLAAGLAVMAAAIFFTHRANIARLIRGEESKIDLGKRAPG
jgi:glycerol-3-phosphate acyltransferase PlsY